MRKNEDRLIPREKTSRIIYLERRGREKKGYVLWGLCFGLLGIICILYCVAIAIGGAGTSFFLIWAVLGAFFVLLGLLLSRRSLMERLPAWFKGMALGLFFFAVLVFGAVEGLILSQYHAVPEPGADYVIILGAQWKVTGPSEVLRRRLDKAIEYLQANPDTKVIVSGGQGTNEPVAEAVGMQEYLVNAGISDTRILVEAHSTNTYENLVFSRGLLDPGKDRVVVVTNNFHLFRAVKIAARQGYENVEGLAASSVIWMAPNNLLREFLGVLKDFLAGNL